MSDSRLGEVNKESHEVDHDVVFNVEGSGFDRQHRLNPESLCDNHDARRCLYVPIFRSLICGFFEGFLFAAGECDLLDIEGGPTAEKCSTRDVLSGGCLRRHV